MLKNLSNMMMLCKLTQLNIKNTRRKTIGKNICSKRYLDFKIPKTRRRIKLDIIESSEDFFKRLPYYQKSVSNMSDAKKFFNQHSDQIPEENESINSRDFRLHFSPGSPEQFNCKNLMSPMSCAGAYDKNRRCSIASPVQGKNLLSP